jgi:acetylornithine deacetylase/succinyl-diaminopimelate desuccinylase-like protein
MRDCRALWRAQAPLGHAAHAGPSTPEVVSRYDLEHHRTGTMKIEQSPVTHIDDDQVADRTFELVSIPSPTGASDAIAERYAEMLDELGLDVTLDRHFAGGPNVIGRWTSASQGPTISFVGHLDTIHAPHAAPRRTTDAVHGRGADDMKGSMAAIVEALAALRAAGTRLQAQSSSRRTRCMRRRSARWKGYAGLSRPASWVRRRSSPNPFPTQHQILAGKGQAIFTITIKRPGEAVHENYAARGTINPIDVAVEVAARLRGPPLELAWQGRHAPCLAGDALSSAKSTAATSTIACRSKPASAASGGLVPIAPGGDEAEFTTLIEPVATATGASIR